MKALIWKELRALRMPAIVVFAMMLGGTALHRWWALPTRNQSLTQSLAWVLVVPILSLGLGCVMVARERVRGELAFSNLWPAPRAQIWAAKLIVGLGLLVALYGLLVALSACFDTEFFYEEVMGSCWPGGRLAPPYIPLVWPTAAGCFMLFGLGFMASGVRPGPFDAIMVTSFLVILLTVAVGFLVTDPIPQRWGPTLGMYLLDPRTSWVPLAAAATVLGAIGIVASAFGALGAPPLAFGHRHWRTVGLALPLAVAAGPLLLVGVRLFGEPQPADIGRIEWAECSPDGRWVSFYDTPKAEADGKHVTYGTPPYRLWLMRSDGSDLRCLARWPVLWGEWSPDSTWLAIAWGTANADAFSDAGRWFWLWDVARQRLHKVPRRVRRGYDWSDLRYTISPRGQYLYLAPEFVRLGESLELVAAELPKQAQGLPAWGRDDGSYCFWAALKRGETKALWAADLPSGGNLRRIAVAPMQGISSTKVSPDGKWIAWSRRRKPGFSYGDIVLENLVDGRKVRLEHLSSMYEPWSPGMAYFWASGEGGLRVVNLAEGRVVRTFTAAELRGNPYGFALSWSPDGKRRLFRALSAAEPDEENQVRLANLWVANADGSGLRSIAEWSGVYAYFDRKPGGWTEDGKVVMVEHQRRIVAIDPETRERKVIFEAPSQKGEAR